MKTVSVSKEQAQLDRKWYIVDLEGKVLGRAATRIASILRGKHTPRFTPNQDTGDFVVALNVSKVVLTGNKWTDKLYKHHTGHPGGVKTKSAREVLAKKPEDLLTMAVQGMLPKTPLGKRMLKKLKVYPNAEHPHVAQQPETLTL